jgi:hypothetical protein
MQAMTKEVQPPPRYRLWMPGIWRRWTWVAFVVFTIWLYLLAYAPLMWAISHGDHIYPDPHATRFASLILLMFPPAEWCRANSTVYQRVYQWEWELMDEIFPIPPKSLFPI